MFSHGHAQLLPYMNFMLDFIGMDLSRTARNANQAKISKWKKILLTVGFKTKDEANVLSTWQATTCWEWYFFFLLLLYLCYVHYILYRYFIALREIYQNVCPEVPGNPRDVIFPEAEKQWNKCYVTFYSWKRLKNRSEILGQRNASRFSGHHE